ncbi:MAG: hypothetical protein OEY91_11160 [Nitrospirota bacterium]|nr:hypothetical protein [Nitrospirota bacterium]
MKSWVIPITAFCFGLGVGLSGPFLATKYMEPYLPGFMKKPLHPLEGIVTHKQQDQDRLLMTVTTQDGTILATFRKQVAEIALLVEEQDSITLDVRQYEPFVNDPPVLKVNKQVPQVNGPSSASTTVPPPPSSVEGIIPPESLLPTPPSTEAPLEKSDTSSPALN